MHSEVPFHDKPWVIRSAWAIVILVFASGIAGGLHRGMKDKPDPDWRAFSTESRHVWEHRSIPPETSMFGYLPAAFFALWPFTTWSPQPAGLIAFVIVNASATIGSWLILRRWWFGKPKRQNAKTPKRQDANMAESASVNPQSAIRNPQSAIQAARPVAAAFVWPVLLTVGHFQHVLQANQFTIWVLFLCLAGLTLLMRRREWLGGFVLGVAACIKVTPLVFALYLALRRQWKALAGMVLALIVCDVVPSVIVFGPGGAVVEHQKWLQRAEWYSNHRLIEDHLLRVRRHGNNCSYAVVLARWLRPPRDARVQVVLAGNPPADLIEQTRANLQPDEYLLLDPRPTPGADWSLRRDNIEEFPRFHIASLDARTVWCIWAGTLAAAIGALVLATFGGRRAPPPSCDAVGRASLPADCGTAGRASLPVNCGTGVPPPAPPSCGTGVPRVVLPSGDPVFTAEAATWLLLMFWATPMMRDYYLALALPAYIVVWRAVVAQSGRLVPERHRWLAIGALAFFPIGGIVGMIWSTPSWYGLHLATLAALGAATVWAWRVAKREQTAALVLAPTADRVG